MNHLIALLSLWLVAVPPQDVEVGVCCTWAVPGEFFAMACEWGGYIDIKEISSVPDIEPCPNPKRQNEVAWDPNQSSSDSPFYWAVLSDVEFWMYENGRVRVESGCSPRIWERQALTECIWAARRKKP